MSETATAPAAGADEVRDDGARHLVPAAAVALVAGGGLLAAARSGTVALLVAVAVVQAAFVFAWVFGTGLPGRRGAFVLGVLAAAGADVAVQVAPHARLGALAAVAGLAVPAMFVHQLTRGTSRAHIVASLSAIAVLIAGVVALPALVQLRHEFVSDPSLGGRVAGAAAGAAAGALVVGALIDAVVAVPRFDAGVRRGLPALVGSAAVGAAVALLLLRSGTAVTHDYAHGRAAFVGAALGAAAALLAVAAAFVLHSTPEPESRTGRLARPLLAALLPLCLLAPGAFLLFLAVRS